MHKSSEEEVVEVKGKMRINNGHIPSVVGHVTLLVTGKTTAKEIVEQALIKFDLVVGPWGSGGPLGGIALLIKYPIACL